MNMTADKQLSDITLYKGRGVNFHDRFYCNIGFYSVDKNLYFSQKIFPGFPISETMRLRIFQKNNNTFLVGMMLSVLRWH